MILYLPKNPIINNTSIYTLSTTCATSDIPSIFVQNDTFNKWDKIIKSTASDTLWGKQGKSRVQTLQGNRTFTIENVDIIQAIAKNDDFLTQDTTNNEFFIIEQLMAKKTSVAKSISFSGQNIKYKHMMGSIILKPSSSLSSQLIKFTI
ncbi:hypothetical protein QTP88_010599 [Uroleucon formosanum]